MLTYKEFTSLVPEETRKLIDNIKNYAGSYINSDCSMTFRGSDHYSNAYETKALFLLLWGIMNDDKYKLLFSKYGFDRDNVVISKKKYRDASEDDLFNDVLRLIPDYSDKTKYKSLTPLDIIIPILKSYSNNRSTTIFDYYFSCYTTTLIDELKNYNEKDKQERAKDVEENMYKNLPIGVVSLLETASRIRAYLLSKNILSKEIISDLKEDIIPLSIFFALFYYDDVPISEPYNISIKSVIKNYLESIGITPKKLGTFTNGNGLFDRDYRKNPYAIEEFYIRYTEDGVNKGKKSSEVTVPSIIENAVNRSFSNSLAIEKLLNKLECPITKFKHFDSIIQIETEKCIRAEGQKYIKDFYQKLSKDVQEFIDFTAKTYSLLLIKMSSKKHNTKLLNGEDDADTLALLIASYFFKGDVSTFYQDHGISLENILTILGISLTREEIESTPLDEKVLIDRFRRFVYEGVNTNMSGERIKIDNINHNLCDRDFNRSTIMESIFSKLADTPKIEASFLNRLLSHIERKERTRRLSLTEELFKDIPAETIEYLENVSRIHNFLLSNNKMANWTTEDIKPLALLIGILKSSNSELQDLYNSQGINLQSIAKYLGISTDGMLKGPVDIDLLNNEYLPFIYGGVNKNKNRSEITVIEVAKNIFNKEISNRVNMSRLLAYFNKTYSSFDDLDAIYTEYKLQKEYQRIEQEYKDEVSNYSIRNYLNRLFSIYTKLKEEYQKGTINKELVSSEKDLESICILLALFTQDTKPVFISNKFNANEIINRLGVTININKDIPFKYKDTVPVFKPYYKHVEPYRFSITDFVSRLFNTESFKSYMERLCTIFGIQYRIVEIEGKTNAPFESSLSTEDRITLLSESTIEPIDLDNMTSIMNFGEPLTEHSKYIHDALPRLALSDHLESSTKTISEMVGQVYTKEVSEPKKQSFLARIFMSEPAVVEEPKYVFNSRAVDDLKCTISSNIEELKKELQAYDVIRKYIEVYSAKNREHYLVAVDLAKKMEEKIKTTNPQDDGDYALFLSLTSALQILQDKANRFATTNIMMKQELLRVNQAIVNHFVTINALEMARDDLLPLVGSEIAIGAGIDTEKSSLEVSQNVLGLFQSLLARNVSETIKSVEQLRFTALDESRFQALNQDVQGYLKRINQVNNVNQKVALALDFDSGKPIDTASVPTEQPIELTLEPDKPFILRPIDDQNKK